ncbi:MAG: hypothetical protein KC940_22290 [Candidatus Omnitrophica bacterium]|nr:hypothetical protein [Candidatus Omnitrophota bacterium]
MKEDIVMIYFTKNPRKFFEVVCILFSLWMSETAQADANMPDLAERVQQTFIELQMAELHFDCEKMKEYLILSEIGSEELVDEYCREELENRPASQLKPRILDAGEAIFRDSVQIKVLSSTSEIDGYLPCVTLLNTQGLGRTYRAYPLEVKIDQDGSVKFRYSLVLDPGRWGESISETKERIARTSLDQWRALSGEELERESKLEKEKKRLLAKAREWTESQGFKFQLQPRQPYPSATIEAVTEEANLTPVEYREKRIQDLENLIQKLIPMNEEMRAARERVKKLEH